MSEREKIKTKHEDIVNYWAAHQDECGLSVDWAEAKNICWRCGCERNVKRQLDRCHIIPDALGGKDEPSNLVLLCPRCHKDGPNVSDPEVMWDWIRAYGHPFYNLFWVTYGQKEYEFIYGNKFMDDIKTIMERAGDKASEEEFLAFFKKALSETVEESSIHFGQPYFNTATMAGRYRMLIKKLAQKYKIDMKEFIIPKEEIPWWSDYLF